MSTRTRSDAVAGPEVGSRSPVVIFLHIPKTGGMTMRQLMRRNYPPQFRYEVRMRDGDYAASVDEISALPEEVKQRVRMIFGHTVFGVHEFLPRPATYLTMLRRPTSLAISAYHFIRGREANWLHDKVRDMNVEEFIRGPVARQGDNIQTRILAGGFAWDRPCTPEMLEEAKANIERDFSLVGLTERFDESVLLWGRRLGWSKIHYDRKNVTPKKAKSAVSPDLLAFIEEHNRFDGELYRFVAERFERDLASYPSLDRKLVRYRRLNKLFPYAWRARPQWILRRLRMRAAAR